MKLRQKAIVSLLISEASAVTLKRLNFFGNEFVGTDSPGMKGNEDLGLDIKMDG